MFNSYQNATPLPNIQAVVAWIVLLNVLLLPLLHYLHVSELLETLFNGRPTTNLQLPLDEELQSGKDTQAGRQAGSMLAISSFKEILTQPLVAFGQKRIAQAPPTGDRRRTLECDKCVWLVKCSECKLIVRPC
ncbi:GPI ethanolamine phosphate transferase [Trichinella spiralis]|uniref:GPI ethanolamine phosphate transferase n=1 Tax=Trichinella spiralis TaxID=6334 RepID=A0ABR3L3F2_TRISP